VPGQAAQCGSPVGYWRDQFRSTHQTHELRISTPDTGKIRAIVGAYYEKFRIYDDMNFSYKSIPACNAANTQLLINSIGTGNIQDCTASVGPAPGSTINVPGLRADNVAFGEDLQRGYDQIAGFGSVDVDLTSTLTVTAGTRYYNYLNTEVGSQYGTGGGCDGLTLYEAALANGGYNGGGLGQCPGSLHNIDAAHDRTRYTGFKSRAGINWKPEDGILIYGLFSQGFRPGGFNRTGGQAKLGGQFIRPYSWTPDTLTNWEAGIKSSWLDHKLTLNLSSYYMVWNNAQIVLFAPTTFGNTAFATNGSTFHIEGAELQVTGRPTSSLTIQGSASYNHARQSSVRPWVSAIDGSPITSAPNPYGAIGSPLPFSPDLQANIHARYEWGGKGDLNWFVASGANYSGSTYNQPANYASGDAVVPGIPSTVQGPNGVIIPTTTLLRYKMPGYALVDASFGFSHDNLTVSVFGENLTNTHVSTFTSSAQFAKSEVPVRPMIYGLKLAIKY
jgi:outer membrane receptor protein involved in Fe transport